jgi:hypothetical protein
VCCNRTRVFRKAARLRAEIHALDPDVPVADLQSLERAIAGESASDPS